MEYNTTREPLIISEYGRIVQNMVAYVKGIEDKEKRTQAAQAVIQSMSIVHTGSKDFTEYRQKLWDHLHVIAGYELDVEAPYPAPVHADKIKPDQLNYMQDRAMKFRYYGRNLENMILGAMKLPEGEEKDLLVGQIANTMKKLYLTWNKETVSDEIINDHLVLLSAGDLRLKENVVLENTQDILNRNRKKPQTNQRPFNQNNKNRNFSKNKPFRKKNPGM